MRKYLTEAGQLFLLAIPVIFAQMAQTAMGVADTIMAGGFSATDMVAVAVGTSIWLPVILLGHGLLLSLTPMVAQFNGSGRRSHIASYVRQANWLAGIVSVLLMVILWYASQVVYLMHNIDVQLAKKATGYLHALLWGIPGYLFFQVARNQCEGLAKTVPGMLVGFIGLLVNILINIIFIYGHLGAPALGGVGCGVATASVYWVMFIALKIWLLTTRKMPAIGPVPAFNWPDWKIIRRLTGLGLPVALAFFFEITQFAIVALLLSPLGVVPLAGHQIALNFSSLIYMLPLSLGVAATVRVGFCLGKGNTAQAGIAAWTAQATGLVITVISATMTILLREKIAGCYTTDPIVISLATQLILLSAIYQFSDAIQVIGSGILRGYKDTRAIFVITFIAYWLLGLPTGWILGLTDWVVPHMGPAGFWWGFIVGLTAAAVMILMRMRYLQRMPAARLLAGMSQ